MIHAAFQMFAYIVYIYAFSIGLWMATTYNTINNAHPVIGILLFVSFFGQPFSGLLEDKLFEKQRTHTAWSYLHLDIGRVAII